MDQPKRPLTVWIALLILVLLALTIGSVLFTMIRQFPDVLAFYSSPLRLIIRGSVGIAIFVGVVFSIPFIWRRRNLGRWIAIGSLFLLAFQIAGFRLIFAETGGTNLDAFMFAILPIVVVVPLLTLGRRTNQYFSPYELELPDPPSPPVFED